MNVRKEKVIVRKGDIVRTIQDHINVKVCGNYYTLYNHIIIYDPSIVLSCPVLSTA